MAITRYRYRGTKIPTPWAQTGMATCLFTALIDETVAAVYRRAAQPDTALSKPLLLVLDEAANIAPLPNLAQLASTARGVGIQLVTVWQDFAQIQALYDKFSATVINNHRAKVVLSGVSDTPTLDYLTRLIGDQPVTETSTTREGDGNIRTTTESTATGPSPPRRRCENQPPAAGCSSTATSTPPN